MSRILKHRRGGGGAALAKYERRLTNSWRRYSAVVAFMTICLLGQKSLLGQNILPSTSDLILPRTSELPDEDVDIDDGQESILKTPTLPVANVDIEVPDANELPLIHIVNSRFMQSPGKEVLETLGIARLKLFLAFCLPSMLQQSCQNFFWIIKTDPEFTKTAVFDMLVESVRSYGNIYVVASNVNFLLGEDNPVPREGSWRDGKEGLDLLQSKIYTGNITRLHAAVALREERHVLETRLDADDGLHRDFIQYLQEVAFDRFKLHEESDDRILTPNWLYWCSGKHIEWHSDNIGGAEVGSMKVINFETFCLTTGLTIGFNVNNVDVNVDVPLPRHNQLYKRLKNKVSCYDKKVANHKKIKVANHNNLPCLEFVEDFLFSCIRARTLTSAGMSNINLDKREGGRQEERLWGFSKQAFGITKTRVKDAQDFLNRNKVLIAEENLKGQCTRGHSCKNSSKEKLGKIIDSEIPKKKV